MNGDDFLKIFMGFKNFWFIFERIFKNVHFLPKVKV